MDTEDYPISAFHGLDIEDLEDQIKQQLHDARLLLEEVTTFLDHNNKRNRQGKTECRHIVADITRDVREVEKLAQLDKKRQPAAFARLRQSNLSFLQAVWDAAKREQGVTRLKQHSSIIDIAAEGGLKWIKVSTVTEKRLLMEMANKGWNWHQSDDSDDDMEDFDEFVSQKKDDEVDLALLKMASKLAEAARSTVVQYRHPRITFVLTRIRTGAVPEIDLVLDTIRAMGITVLGSNHLSPVPPLSSVINRMTYDAFEFFTSTVNLDCTVLLALVSDISHENIEQQQWFNQFLSRQLQVEDKEKLLPEILFPAMGSRTLTCTREAATRMAEIVKQMGTPKELIRTQTFMDQSGQKTREELIQTLQEYSNHKIPEDLQLPIRLCESIHMEDKRLPTVARTASEELSDLNRSVFLTGWAMDYTTLTSNRVVTKQIETKVVEQREEDDELGPQIWVCQTSRSLLAKEKDRK